MIIQIIDNSKVMFPFTITSQKLVGSLDFFRQAVNLYCIICNFVTEFFDPVLKRGDTFIKFTDG